MDIEVFKDMHEHKRVKEYTNSVAKNPLVSVCIQTYQHEDYIKECLDSIINQKTDFQFEVLLGEDASNDSTRAICIRYAKRYPNKIRLFLHHRENNIKINGQPTGRFNFVYNLYSSKGKYIALCEGDDYWTDPLKLQKQVDFLEANEDYAICGALVKCLIVEGDNKEFSDGFFSNTKTTLTTEDFLSGYPMHTSSVLFRRYMLQLPGWFTKITNGDVTLFALLSEKGMAHFMQEVVSVYRVTDTGVWSSVSLEKRYYAFKNTVNHLNKHFKGTYKKQQYNWEFNEAKKVAQEFLNKRSYKQYVKFILKNYHRYFWWFIWLPKQTQIINFIRNSVQIYWIKFRMFVGLRTHLKKITALFSTTKK